MFINLIVYKYSNISRIINVEIVDFCEENYKKKVIVEKQRDSIKVLINNIYNIYKRTDFQSYFKLYPRN